MSTRVVKFLALFFALVAFTLRLLGELFLEAKTLIMESGALAIGLWMAILASSFLIPLGGYRLSTRGARSRPSSFGLDSRRHLFLVPSSQTSFGSFVVLLAWLAGGSLLTEQIPGEGRSRLVQHGFAGTAGVVICVLILAFITVWLFLDRPRLALGRDKITVYGWSRRNFIGWDRVASELLPPAEGEAATVGREGAANSSGDAVFKGLPADRLNVDQVFLLQAIRVYADQPERRDAIGTAAELARLRSSVGVRP